MLVAADSDPQQQCEITSPANNRLSGLMTPRITCLIWSGNGTLAFRTSPLEW